MAYTKNAGTGQLLRPRYFPRQMVTAADLNAEQSYFRDMLRRHNRFLHGCGVVWGLEVLQEPATAVRVTAGHAIGPQGDEIHVPVSQTISLQDQGGECAQLEGGRRVYLVIRYREWEVEPVASLPERCAPKAASEFSRVQPGFEIACRSEQPEGCPPGLDCGLLLTELLRDAPPGGPEDRPLGYPIETNDPWIVLAALGLSPSGQVLNIDYSVRQRVLSAQLLTEALRCLVSMPSLTAIFPASGAQGNRLVARISGERLAGASAVQFAGPGISAHVLPELGGDGYVVVLIDIAPAAPLGPRHFQVTTPRGIADSAAFGLAFTVLPRLEYPYGYGVYGYSGLLSRGIGGELL
jgi:hypothetical protein